MYNQETNNAPSSFQGYRERITNFSNEFELGLFLYIVKKSLKWVFLCLAVSIASAYVYLRYTEPVYETNAILQLGNGENTIKLLNVNNLYEERKISADIELLRSKFLLKKALSRLDLEVSYYGKGEFLTHEQYIHSPYRIELIALRDSAILDAPVALRFYEDLSIELNTLGNEVELDYRVPSKIFRTQWMDFRIHVQSYRELMQTQQENAYYFVVNNMEGLANRYKRSLQVRVLNQQANTIEISFKNNNAIIARDFVMALSQTFIRHDLEKKVVGANSVIEFIENQIDTVFTKLRSSEFLLQTFKKENKVTDLEAISSKNLKKLTDLENELLKLELEEELLREIENSTQQPSNEIDVFNLIPLVAGSEYAKTLSAMIQTLHDLVVKREELLYRVTKENDVIHSLNYQIDIQKRLILQTIQSLNEKLQAKISGLTQKIAEYERNFFDLPTKELEYARLMRLFNINEKYYTMLLEKKIEHRIAKAGIVPDNQILEEAKIPKVPISPRSNLIIVSFVMGGVVLSLFLILFRYFLHNNLTSLNEIAKLSNASIKALGIIPKYNKEIPTSQLVVDKNPKSLIAEAFRSIRTNLQFISDEEKARIIGITSTISGEGKTFVAINLAGIISYSGKKVIVLDLDMRRPKIHLGFGVDNLVGMSMLLIGKDTLDHCIQKSNLPNLDFITAGPIPPNPSELIISPKMDEVIEELKQRYDMIIIDSPPAGLVTDGVSIIQRADYPIYVFRADYSKKHFVHNVDRLINENDIEKLSVILNGVDIERNRFYNYGYGYGYGYGYSYGDTYGGGYYDEYSTRKKNALWRRIKAR